MLASSRTLKVLAASGTALCGVLGSRAPAHRNLTTPKVAPDMDEKKELVGPDDFVLAPSPDGAEDHLPPSSEAGLLARGRGMRRGRSEGVRASVPPLLDCTPAFRQVLRFAPTANTLKTITAGDLRFAAGSVATDSTHVRPFCSAVRLLHITIWPGSSSSGTGAFDVQWVATTEFDKDSVFDGTLPQGTIGGARRFVPPPRSLASNWLNASSATAQPMFAIECNANSVVDVTLDCVLSNGYAADAAGAISGPATVGSTYWMALDFNTGHVYVPVGRPTIF